MMRVRKVGWVVVLRRGVHGKRANLVRMKNLVRMTNMVDELPRATQECLPLLLFGPALAYLQAGCWVRQQALCDVGVGLVNERKLRVANERDALKHADRADDEREVGRDAEGVVERDLRQVRCEFLEVYVLGATALESLQEDKR
jgi:hypothetical protein